MVGGAAARVAAGKSGAGCVVPQIAQIFADGIGGMLHNALWVSGARPSINLRKSAKSADTNRIVCAKGWGLMKNPVSFVRVASLVEAVSYLVLLGVAMPLKYYAGMPMAVRIVGSLHGLLFVILCVALLGAMMKAKWSVGRAAAVFVASFIPLVPFWLDRRMREWEAECGAGK